MTHQSRDVSIRQILNTSFPCQNWQNLIVRIQSIFTRNHLQLARHHSTGRDRTRYLECTEMESLSSKLLRVYHKRKEITNSLVEPYPILTISAVVSSSRRLERSYPRSASSRKRVSSASDSDRRHQNKLSFP